jgi:hypothetical protein
MGKRPVRSVAVHWSRYTVNALVAPAGMGEARQAEVRETREAEGDAEETRGGERQAQGGRSYPDDSTEYIQEAHSLPEF